jgi:methylated-DNA-[protein]-cysteine S-methyltransferase
MPAQTSVSFALFDTAVGRCAIAWSACGIVAVLLPERDDAALRARLRRRHPAAREAAPSDEVTQAIDGIVALVAGEPRDLAYIALDLTGVPEFNRRVYAAARAIRPGETLTYGAIAARLGEPDARRIGEAMRAAIPAPLSFPATAWSRPAAKPAASRPPAASSPSGASSPSKAPQRRSRHCSIAAGAGLCGEFPWAGAHLDR